MSAHLIADETTTATVVDRAIDPGWCALSAAMTDEVPSIADREDLLVTVAPGAGHGSPACFLPNQATIEVDGTHLGVVDPATATPQRVGDRARYATAWGLLTHECAHARHTTWEPPDDAAPGALAASLLLEESRIEAAQIRRRPDDRHWLRASATELVLADTRADDPLHTPPMSAEQAGRAAALLLARVDAGILTTAETQPVARAIDTVIGADTLTALRALWQAAHQLADDDAAAMLELGRRWCDTLGSDPATATPTSAPPATGSPTDPTDPSAGSGVRSPLATAIADTLSNIAAAVAREPVPADPTTLAAEARAAEQHARDTADTAAHAVFSVGRGPRNGGALGGTTATAGSRSATEPERAAARTLARALTTAGVRDRVATKTTSITPPGRLRMRGALAADAQRAAGALPTAEPFTRTTRRTVPTPPLRLGIACDVSGSMHAFAGPVASAAWILAHAAHHAQLTATTATVIFGARVRPITTPGTTPTDVAEFHAHDGYEDIPTAIDALDGALGLARTGAARLLVIVSDGQYRAEPRRQGQPASRDCSRPGAGCCGWPRPGPSPARWTGSPCTR